MKSHYITYSCAGVMLNQTKKKNVFSVSATDLKILLLLEELKNEAKLHTKLLLKLGRQTEKQISIPSLPEGITFPISNLSQMENIEEKLADEEVVNSLVCTFSCQKLR